MKRSAKPPLVIHIFSPFSTKLPSGLPRRARLRAERVGAGSGLAQAVGADELAGQQPRQVLLLLRLGAEQRQRQDRQVRLRAEGRAERRRPRHPLADDERRDLVEADAAVGLGHVDAEQPELAAALHQRRAPAPSPSARADRAPAALRCRRTPAAVWPISRCSSVSRSGVKTASASVGCSSHSPPRSSRGASVVVVMHLHSLEDTSRAHAAADAHRDQAVARACAASSRRAASSSASRRCSRADGRARSRRR